MQHPSNPSAPSSAMFQNEAHLRVWESPSNKNNNNKALVM
jgi:hypothetical protein